MICNECGTQFKEGAAFCSGCGTPVAAREPYARRQPSTGDSTLGFNTRETNSLHGSTLRRPVMRAAQPAMACSFHPALAAMGVCVSCGSFFGRDCLVMYDGRHHCRRCWGSYSSAPLPAQPQQIYIPPVQYVYRRKEPGLAVILSFFMPGLGQFYNGEVGKGLGFLIGFWLLVWFFIGIGLWIWSMMDAYQVATQINAGRRA